MTIINAVQDANLFGPFLGDLSTWRHWFVALSALYGLPVHPSHAKLVRDCTGRDRKRLPRGGFSTALFLTGRRSGKSRIAAIIGAFESVWLRHGAKLAKGEKGAGGRVRTHEAPSPRGPQLYPGRVRRPHAQG
jgi:hypothetical protein